MRFSRLLLIALALGVFDADAALAQQSPPWSGIAANEARPNTPQQYGQGSSEVTSHAMSADGRFVVFDSSLSHLVYGDVNGFNDVFMRDRQTGELTLISRANDGSQGNSYSAWPTISANGRYVAFNSCASNFDPADTNGRCDLFIRDNTLGTIVRGNVGPNGEQATNTTQHAYRLSGDGRYFVFVGDFDPDLDNATTPVWLRDRDTDGNGIFDEPGMTSTTQISQSSVGDYTLEWFSQVAISNDGRWIAYTAETYVDGGRFAGTHIYLYDPVNGTTALVDRTTVGFVDEYSFAGGPDFSEAGHLAYTSNANNLTEGDTDGNYDVFVFNVLTGGNTLVELTYPGAPNLPYAWSPAISADGRYVAFTGVTVGEWWNYQYNVYAVDRQTGFSTAISTRPDGTLDNNTGAPSISADGLSIAFHANPEMLVWGWGNTGIFVATDVHLSPDSIDVPAAGGTFSIDVTVPAGIAWTLTPTGMNVSQNSGVGSATIDVTVPANTSTQAQDYVVLLGSEQVTLHQAVAPQIYWVYPFEGSPLGGTEVTVNGQNFIDGATVAFDGIPATNVVFIGSTTLHATTPAHALGYVDVSVTNPDGASATLPYGFNYVDNTPPVVTYQVTGTVGQNGWYTSDVDVTFHYEDPESEVFDNGCASPFHMTWDAAYAFAICNVYSQGGETAVDVDVKRDTVPPTVSIAPAYPETFAQGQQIPIARDCQDETSGIASCTANQAGPYLDTSSVGTFTYSATGADLAGHSTTTSVSYTVKMITSLTVPVATSMYGNATALLHATLTASSGPVAGKTITFFVDNIAVGNATTGANGEAALDFPLNGRSAGTWELHAEFAGDDTAFATMMSSALNIAKATPVVTWANPSFIVAGTPLGSTQLNATASIAGAFNYTPGFSTVLPAGLQTLSVQFTPQDATNYEVVTKTVTLKVKGIPVITWPAPAAITYLTSLTGAQLNATANVAGSFVYTPPFGTLLEAGTQTLSVTFTPSNTADYVAESSTTTIVVNKATATINWPSINPITYGTPLSGLQLNATSYADGSITYSPPYGTILSAGTHTITATFNPNYPYNYEPATATRAIVVGKAYPVVYWQGDLAPIVYGTPLTSAQLYATSPNAGTITYNPPAGTLLDAGLRTISMTFTPDDTANYNTVTYQKEIAVDKQTTTITWSEPQSIVYGTALGAAQLNATASQAGTLTYDPPLGTVLNAGPHQLSVYFTPTNPNYYGGTRYVTLLVTKRTPTITWNSPSAIVYGTALSNTQLNASANTPGTFTYTPAAGAILSAGTQLLVVDFQPSDSANNNAASGSTTIVVNKAAPVITWPDQGHITYGTALSASQLNATANVPGSFTYSPDFGAVLPAGNYSLSVTFTPSDSANYASASDTALLAVFKQTATVSWAPPAAITYGTPLSATQLNATANVPGTFVYIPAAGTVLGAGTPTIFVNFTPDDTANYQAPASVGVTLQVNQATPVITWPTPSSITWGTALSSAQLNATANVPGSFTYNPGSGVMLAAGSHTLGVTFTPSDTVNYTAAAGTVTIGVNKATPVITWAAPSAITYGAALSATQLNATASVAGTFTYTPASGTVLNAGAQQLSVTFTPADTDNYNGATASVAITVNKATPTLTWAQPANIQYGTALSSTQYNASASVAGSFVYSPPAGTVPHVGGVTMTATLTPSDTGNYNAPAPLSKTIFVSKAPLTLQVNNATKVYGQALPVFGTTGTGFVNGDTLASVANPPFYNTTATATSAPGTYSVTLSGYSSTDYTITALAGTLTVTKASTSVALTTTPNPSTNNQQVQLRAVVSAVAPGAGTATGTVEFRENGTLLGTATLVNGVATINKSFKRGSHPLTATYIGDANFNSSTGNVTHQTN